MTTRPTIIAGSRWIGVERAAEVISLIELCPWEIGDVITGGAPGVDAIGLWWAVASGRHVHPWPADWRKHGKAAGPIRNRAMAEYAAARGGGLVLVWDGKSPGSRDMLTQARREGLDIFERIVEASR